MLFESRQSRARNTRLRGSVTVISRVPHNNDVKNMHHETRARVIYYEKIFAFISFVSVRCLLVVTRYEYHLDRRHNNNNIIITLSLIKFGTYKTVMLIIPIVFLFFFFESRYSRPRVFHHKRRFSFIFPVFIRAWVYTIYIMIF